MKIRERAKTYERGPPGQRLNPEVVNWYTESAFKPQYEKDDMSKMYPWLFGDEGLYSGVKCRYPCRMVNGVCVCPE